MSKLVQHLALVSESARISLNDVLRVSGALQKQATRDLLPIWDISATVDAYARLEDVPTSYWPMIVMDDIGYDAAGIHLDRNGQPFALISSNSDIDVWSLTASHEALEMLVDPFGNRIVAGDSLMQGQGRVDYLVEVCDPSEAAEFGYTVNGILVSDFYTANFFDPARADGVRYSYTSAISEPRQVLRGGYLSWRDPVTDHWWQQTWFGGAEPQFVDLGRLDASRSIRSQIDRLISAETSQALEGGRSRARVAGMALSASDNASVARAASLREQISGIISSP
jgi:hypothetical protein